MDSTIAESMNDNINMDSTIARSMNDNINMDSTIVGSMNDNINMDSTIAGSVNVIVTFVLCCHFLGYILIRINNNCTNVFNLRQFFFLNKLRLII